MIQGPPVMDRPLVGMELTTHRRLETLGLHEIPLPKDLRSVAGVAQRPHLTAARWLVGDPKAPLAECRFVRILGKSSEIVNTLIFPFRPEAFPTFVAEILVFGGCPRVVFVDLQVPGLRPDRANVVSARTCALAAEYRHLLENQEAPAWSVEYSAGGYVFTRPKEPAALVDVLELYDDYLATWCDLAATWTLPVEDVTDPVAQSELSRYKQHHIEQSPVKDFLAKVFGADWMARFLYEFLYQ